MKAGKVVGGILFGIPGLLVGSLVDNILEENQEAKEIKQKNARLESELKYHEDTLDMANMTKEDLRFQVGCIAPYAIAILSNIYVQNSFNPAFAEVWINSIHATFPGYKHVTNLEEFKSESIYFKYNPMHKPRTLLFDTPSKKREVVLFLDNLVSTCNWQAQIFVNRNKDVNAALLAYELKVVEEEIVKICNLYK